jgi:tetratricopeptide (TPR) repeat protein
MSANDCTFIFLLFRMPPFFFADCFVELCFFGVAWHQCVYGKKTMARIFRQAAVATILGILVAGVASCSHHPLGASFNAQRKLGQAAEKGEHGDFSSAVRLATEVVDQEPSHALAYVVRGVAYRRGGNYSQAIADLDRAIELDPQNADAYTQRAFACQQGNSHATSQQIRADLNRAIQLNATSALPYILRGNELAALNDHNAAIADYDQALKLNPHSYNALAGRAASKMGIGKLNEARHDLQRAMSLNPPDADRRQIEELLRVLKSREAV